MEILGKRTVSTKFRVNCPELCVFTKSLAQEITCNFGILRVRDSFLGFYGLLQNHTLLIYHATMIITIAEVYSAQSAILLESNVGLQWS